VDIASIHFEKDVILWFQMLHRMSAAQTNVARFDKSSRKSFWTFSFQFSYGRPFQAPTINTVLDYYLKFMALANRSEGLSDATVLHSFLSGLNREIRRDVVPQCPTNLLRAMALAKLYKDKYTPLVQERGTNYNHKYSSLSSSNINASPAKITPKQSLLPLLPTPSILQPEM